MARALRSSGASGAATSPTPPATNGTATRARALKRKRNGDDDHSPKPAPRRDGTDSASPLTDLAPSPAVKHEVDDPEPPTGSDNAPNGDDHADTGDGDAPSGAAPSVPRSPTPGAFVDGCDQPPSADDAHKLLTVLEMFDTQNLLARHVPPAGVCLRAMLKNPTHSIRSLKACLKHPYSSSLTRLQAAITALAPTQAHPRARLSLEQTAQRSFCDLALGLLDEISQKQPASKDRTSIFHTSAEHKAKLEDDTKPTRYALQQTIHGADYYTSVSSDSLTPNKAAILATGHASLTAILPAASVPISSMHTLGTYNYSRRPTPSHALWYIHQGVTASGITELSYGSRCSFAPTYDSSGATVTRSEVDDLVARRMKGSKAFGPPPPLPPPLPTDRDTEMADDAASQKTKAATIHPDLVPVPAIDPSLESNSTSPPTPSSIPKIASALDPTLDPELCTALDAALQELALEDSMRGLLESNARAMTRLVDLQNERFQKWDLRKPDPRVLDVGEGEELQLARCIEKTLGLLTSLRPRTILSSLPSEPTSLIPPASALRALHRTLPTEPSPGYRGTLDPRREMSLRDDTTIKMANVPAPVPAPPAVGTPRSAVVPLAAAPARSGYPQPTAPVTGYFTQGYQTPVGQYPQAQVQPQGAYPQGQYAGYQQPQAQQQQQGQYSIQYPTTVQQGQYPVAGTPTQAPAGQTQYPYPYNYSATQAATYPQTGYTAPAQPGATGASAYPAPTPGQNPVYPAPTPATGQAPMYPTQAQAGTYPTPAQGTNYPTAGQPAAYPAPGQAATYPTPGQATTYPTPGQATTYPTPTTGYPTSSAANYPTPAPAPAATATPRVITNMIKPVTQGVWSPGQGYTATPTSAAPTGYNPGYNPAVAGTQPQYPSTPGTTGPYSPSPTGAYAATPIKSAAALRGPIPPHVRSTPGTPASPSTYLPGTPGNVPLPAVGAAPYAAWNGQVTPTTPRPT
ncbi:unnamed protein product [Rhizoctonia solani]|uniref:Uncharacterized protein n=1 Tax=Rhizoctonia solani TaxID=456999 RepID=A0A8H3D931_9AGAM|nr:unnamed protein product [Rhizoctonia solani]